MWGNIHIVRQKENKGNSEGCSFIWGKCVTITRMKRQEEIHVVCAGLSCIGIKFSGKKNSPDLIDNALVDKTLTFKNQWHQKRILTNNELFKILLVKIL